MQFIQYSAAFHRGRSASEMRRQRLSKHSPQLRRPIFSRGSYRVSTFLWQFSSQPRGVSQVAIALAANSDHKAGHPVDVGIIVGGFV
jgi:hypothetical protein